MLAEIVNVYSLIVMVAVFLSWVPSLRETQPGRFVETVTEPVFQRIRSVVPPIGGLDLSPLVLLFFLQIVRRLVS
jgi:YggT family protein